MEKNMMQIMDDDWIRNNHLLIHYRHLKMMKEMYKEKPERWILEKMKRINFNAQIIFFSYQSK
jgi:hypothetical protein